MHIRIHNITSEAGVIVEQICKLLMLQCSATISFVSCDSYDYEIDIDHAKIVPFMIRFFHKVDNVEYEKIEVL